MPVLTLKDIAKEFVIGGGQHVYAVDEVSLSVEAGQTLAVIGESGSGKSTLGRLALRLLEPTRGSVYFEGRDLADLDARELRRTRERMQIIFQEPFESLNPRLTIADNIAEPLVVHRGSMSRAARHRLVEETLDLVGLGADMARRYPGELSGGQQQRIGIARAIITRPSFVVLDEPTSSLDLSVRAQILKLLQRLQSELQLAYLFISHDIHTVRYISDQILIMYQGRVVETGPTEEVFASPQHPYTKALLASALSINPDETPPPLSLGGDLPTPTKKVVGCVLQPRCPERIDQCASKVPLQLIGSDHEVACVHVEPATTSLKESTL